MIGVSYHCDSGYPLDPALVPKGMRVYPWPNRRSASRGRWEHAEAGADNLSFANSHGSISSRSASFFASRYLHTYGSVDMEYISATK